MNLWKVEQQDTNKFQFKRVTPSHFYDHKAIVEITVNRQTGEFWSLSAHQRLVLFAEDMKSIKYDLSTLMNRIQTIQMNPFDPNLIAIGSTKRVSLVNLSNVSETHFAMNNLTTKVQSHVLSIAWHPEKENILAFSTKEGRVGVFDVNRLGGQPIIMLPFSGKEVYSVTWVKRDGVDVLELFCCTVGKLVYYPQQGSQKYKAVVVEKFKNVACVSVHKSYLLVGCYKGEVLICSLDTDLTVS